jgi:hypothetical protein
MRSFFLARYRRHKKHLANMLMAASAAAGLAASSAQATSIPITNPGFEINDKSNGFTSANYAPLNGGVDGWVSGGPGGYFLAAAAPTTSHSGAYSGYGNGASTLTQILPNSGGLGLWAAGTYTLDGFASAFGTNDTLTVTLRNGATVLGTQASLAPAPRNVFTTPLTSLVVVIAPGNVNIGSPISIRITGQSAQWYVDDISLNFEAVPEPGSFSLICIGAGALGLTARRRRTSNC